MKKLSKGFTLLELVVVLIIIGTIAAFAMPVYQNHVAKTQASELLKLIEPLKLDIMKNIQTSSQCITKNVSKSEQRVGQSGTYGSAMIANTDSYKVQFTQNDDNNEQYNPYEDTGCRIYIRYKTAGTHSKIQGKEVMLGVTYNGTVISIKGDVTNALPDKFIPNDLLAEDKIVDKKSPTLFTDILFTDEKNT